MSNMMQTELFQVSWPNYSTIDYSYFQGAGGNYQDVPVCSLDFSSSIEDFSDVSSSVPFTSNLNSDEFHNTPSVYDHQYLMVDDQVEKTFSEWMEADESAQLSQSFFVVDDSSQPSLIFPCEDMETDTQLSILHLLKAYGEAMENEQKELAEEILRRLREKANPIGATVERLAYYLIKDFDKEEEDFLRRESSKNYDAAYKAFYQIFPYGRFAHFTANSVILESMPDDAETVVHIVDFDIGKGVQWPPLIEEFGRRGNRVARLTSLRWLEEEEEDCFEDTKRRLIEHAESCGVRLMVEEMDMESLVRKMKKTKNMSTEWLAFNCMVDLPHMGRSGSSLIDVINFSKVAKDSITQSNTSRGIMILGDGSGVEKVLMKGSYSGFGPYFEGQVSQFHELCESMESHLPHHLTEARIAMECLFVAPYMSYITGFERWEEISREGRGPPEIGLEGRRMSKDNFLEAKEVVREGESLYWVRVEGECQNKMVLGYMGTPLVSVSSWR